MEQELREEIKRDIVREEDLHVKEERSQLHLQLDALKREIAEKEARIGAMRRDLIDAVKVARMEAEKELQNTLLHQEQALQETKQSLLERLNIQGEVIRDKEHNLESQQRSLDEQIKAKEVEFRRKYEKFEEELLKHNREVLAREDKSLEDKFVSKLASAEERLRAKEEQLESRRQELDGTHAKRLEELEKTYHHKNEQEWGRLQERVESERKFLEQHYREKETRLEEDLRIRHRDVLTHFENQETEALAKYQALQDQLVAREKDLWRQNQKKLDEQLARNHAELTEQRESLERDYAGREAAVFEQLRQMETPTSARRSRSSSANASSKTISAPKKKSWRASSRRCRRPGPRRRRPSGKPIRPNSTRPSSRPASKWTPSAWSFNPPSKRTALSWKTNSPHAGPSAKKSCSLSMRTPSTRPGRSFPPSSIKSAAVLTPLRREEESCRCRIWRAKQNCAAISPNKDWIKLPQAATEALRKVADKSLRKPRHNRQVTRRSRPSRRACARSEESASSEPNTRL